MLRLAYRRVEQPSCDPEERPHINREGEAESQSRIEQIRGVRV